MTRYRIYTEDKNHARLMGLACLHLHPGFTAFTVQGFWKGAVEKSLVIEFITDKEIDLTIIAFCNAIKDFHSQEAVLWTRETIYGSLI